MLRSQLIKYTEFNIWANQKISDLILQAGEEKTDSEQRSSFTSIRKTLYHIYDAEFIWTLRLKKETLLNWPPSKEFNGTLLEFVNHFLKASENFSALVKNYSEEDLQSSLAYKNVSGKEFTNVIADIIMHVMNHSTYHRGQLITLLRGTGFTDVVATDFIAYCREV